MQMCRKLFLSFIVSTLFLLINLPVYAHDPTMGYSKWSFDKDSIKATITLDSSMLEMIKEINEGYNNIDSCTASQLQQIAADIIQPYINQKLTISINGKVYPVKVYKLVKGEITFYNILLSVENIDYTSSTNKVKITYSLLFEESGGAHINIASLHLPNSVRDGLEYVFAPGNSSWEGTIDDVVTVSHMDKNLENSLINNSTSSPETNSQTVKNIPQKTESSLTTDKKTDIKAIDDNNKKSSTSQTPLVAIIGDTQKKQAPQVNNYTSSSTVTSNTVTTVSTQNSSVVTPTNKEKSSFTGKLNDKPFGSDIKNFFMRQIKSIITGYYQLLFLLPLIIVGFFLRKRLR